MTENTTNSNETDAGSTSALITADSPDKQADLLESGTVPADEKAGTEDLTGTDEDDDLDDDEDLVTDGAAGAGAVSGGLGFAGLALAVVSLTTNWTSSIVVSHGQYSEEIKAPSTGLTGQQSLDMYANGWHTQGWFAFAFAAAAVLLGVVALLLPGLLRGDRTPGWVKAASTGAIIVGVVGVVLAVLTITGVIGGHLTAPTSAG